MGTKYSRLVVCCCIYYLKFKSQTQHSYSRHYLNSSKSYFKFIHGDPIVTNTIYVCNFEMELARPKGNHFHEILLHLYVLNLSIYSPTKILCVFFLPVIHA